MEIHDHQSLEEKKLKKPLDLINFWEHCSNALQEKKSLNFSTLNYYVYL